VSQDFASFYETSRDDCLRTVLASVGDMDTAQEMVAEAFARAWASWLTQPLPAGCQAPKMSDRANAHLQNKILTPPAVLAFEDRERAKAVQNRAKGVKTIEILPSLFSPSAGVAELYINPAAIPPGIGLSIGVAWHSNTNFGWGVDLVVTSPQCTGS